MYYNCMTGLRKNIMTDVNSKEREEYLIYSKEADVIRNLEDGIRKLDYEHLDMYAGFYLIAGGMIGFNKDISIFLNNWNQSADKLFLLSEVTAEYRRYTDMLINFPHLCTPHLLGKEIIIQNMPILYGLKYKKICMNDKLLKKAVYALEAKYSLGEGYSFFWSYMAQIYIKKLLDLLKPSKVFLWNQHYAFHILFSGICKRKKIPVFYIEYGCVPGTYMIESNGQQGQSRVRKQFNKFRKLYVNENELSEGKRVINYVYEKELNRYVQPPKNNFLSRLSLYNSSRKTVFFAGQNDFEAGIVPYTKINKADYSPVFKSTLEALEYLRLICIKKKWNLLFRPHPILSKNLERGNSLASINLNSIIDVADVTITIVSQVSYMSLFRYKPVVMLGYNELYKKGCIYPAYKKYKIERQLVRAIKYGFTDSQIKLFQKHVSQLLKYCLFDDMLEKKAGYGRDIQLGFEEIW